MKANAVFENGMLFDVELSRESSLTFAQRTERSEGKNKAGIWEGILGKGSYRCKGP